MLDPIARSEDPVGILWRKRLALSSAVAVSQLEGRREGEAVEFRPEVTHLGA